jgi:hypothetical protein
LPLQNGHYIEVVCPLEHPAVEQSPFGQAVLRRANEGGGWFSWALAVDNISNIESRLGRSAVEGHRRKPDGKDLEWKQLGILDVMKDAQLPFFVNWTSLDHPSTDGKAISKIVEIEIAGDAQVVTEWLDRDISTATGDDIEIQWLSTQSNEGDTGIVAVHLLTPTGVVRLD